MIERVTIEHIADRFWTDAGGRSAYGHPVAIERAVETALQIPVIRLSNLTFDKADDYLKRIGGPQDAPGGDHRLHGLIVADQDTAIIFLDAGDEDDEQRATVAHEAAHFVRHYVEPRERVRRLLGSSVDDVLSRKRPPTPAEQFGAVMRGVPLTCFRCGEPYDRASLLGAVREVEDEADAIALEILAPRKDIQKRRIRDPEGVAREYAIPLRMAQLAAQFMEPARQAPSILDIFRTRSGRG